MKIGIFTDSHYSSQETTCNGERFNSKSLEKTDLTNRPDFNYIEAGEVHITPTVAVPKWVREGAEDQLVGVRIWHKAFDPACYEDNE